MKHGPIAPEAELQAARSHAQSPCSPVPPALWDAPMAGKSAHTHPGGYINSFGHWYPSPQDTLPRPHMMWLMCDFYQSFHRYSDYAPRLHTYPINISIRSCVGNYHVFLSVCVGLHVRILLLKCKYSRVFEGVVTLFLNRFCCQCLLILLVIDAFLFLFGLP